MNSIQYTKMKFKAKRMGFRENLKASLKKTDTDDFVFALVMGSIVTFFIGFGLIGGAIALWTNTPLYVSIPVTAIVLAFFWGIFELIKLRLEARNES